MDSQVELSWQEQNYEKNRRPTLRNSHNACSDSKNRNVYVFGGRSKGGSNNHLYVLSMENLQSGWRLIDAKGAIPSPRKSSGLCYYQNALYLFGGNSKDRCMDDFYRYNIDTQTWTQIFTKRTPPSRDRHSLSTVKNVLLLHGGHNENEDFLGDLWLFDPHSSKWSPIRTKQDHTVIPRYEHTAAAVDDSLIITGGKCKKGGLADVQKYSLTSNRWEDPGIVESFKREARWGQSSVTFHKRVIFFGGWNGKSCFNDVQILDCGGKAWRWLQFSLTGLRPSIRTFHGSAVMGSKMLIVAGRNMTKRLNDTYLLDLRDLAPGGQKRRMSLRETANLQNNLNHVKPTTQLHKDSKKGQIRLTSFEQRTTLGTGSFGRVRLVRYKDSGEIFAMKMLRKKKVVDMKQENHIKWEKKILHSIRHPFIVNLEASFQDKYFLYLVLEIVPGGEFFSLLRKTHVLAMQHAVFYGAQIVLVFQFLHKNKIVYRDLKPENLLIGADGYLRLTDFGFAKRLEAPYRTWTLCGTPEYIAPEILLNRGHSFSVDWWALGILLFEMFTGNPPFVDELPMKIYQKILDGRINYPARMEERAKDFIAKLLTKNLSQRLGNLENGAVDVMKHTFFRGVEWRRVLERQVTAPYIPPIKGLDDTHLFDPYDEDTDTEETALDNDPFEHDF